MIRGLVIMPDLLDFCEQLGVFLNLLPGVRVINRVHYFSEISVHKLKFPLNFDHRLQLLLASWALFSLEWSQYLKERRSFRIF